MPSSRDGFVRLRVQAGHDWDALVAYAVRRGTGRHRGDVGHPRHRRRGAGAEHRRLRAGDRPDARRGRAHRRGHRRGLDRAGRRTGSGLPHIGPQAPLRLGARARGGHPDGDARARRGRPGRTPRRRASSCARALGLRARGIRLAGVGPRPRALDPPPQGHGARRGRPRHVQRGLVLPERDRLRIVRAHASRPSARAGR